MQCLFCGKELALLKRLRGGGEFCSEAHRKEYQEQYEQLALARLMQAKPPTESPLPAGVQLHARDPRLESPHAEAPIPAAVVAIETPASSQPPPEPAEEGSPAPLAGFVTGTVVPAVAPFGHAGLIELDNAWKRETTWPSLPAVAAFTDSEPSAPSDSQGSLPPAPRVELALSLQALGHHTRTSKRGSELREFTGTAPVMELHLSPETGTEPAGAADVMEILMSPRPPQKAKPWLGLARGFPAVPAELGDLARLDFATTTFAYSDGSVSATPRAAVLAPELPPAPPQVVPEVPPQAPFEAEPEPEAFTAPAEPVPSAEPLAEAPAPPEPVTQALAVTLHGLAALRGKLAQTFTSAISAASDVQIPPSAALPLRPMIVFGPAPAPARSPEAAASPVQPKEVQPEQVQPRPVQPAPAQPQTEERLRSPVVPAPKPVPIKRSVAAETPVSPRVEPRVEPRKESFAPKPPEATAPSDTSFPSLRLDATESAWSKLSTGLKIGVAAAVIVGLSGIAYLVTRGNGKTTEAPVAATAIPEVATGVAISGGWIDDWANAAQSQRHISVLSGSAKLSDYRLEFQAQIQTKAIGWIFRGLNPRNYYVTKLEIVTPGLEPTIALVHFAVVDGHDENRVAVPLPMKVRIDTTYKIRFDAIGNRFTTWVQDQKIDEWTDSRFGSGGVGFFSEQNEQAAMQGTVNVVPLVPRN
jgi:hypothetical protein